MNTELTVDEEHPLALELKSLRATVLRYQHEASSAAVKLQRHSLDTTLALERAQALENENRRLTDELTVLRAHPDTTPQPAALQIPELTNALRHLSDKLTEMEATLRKRTVELTIANSELAKLKTRLSAAQESESHVRLREAECLARERHLVNSLRAAREEGNMADLVVQEYADLVRDLTTKSPGAALKDPGLALNQQLNGSSPTMVDSLSDGKFGLHNMLREFSAATENLEAEISRLNLEVNTLQTERQAEQEAACHCQAQLAEVQVALDKLRADDNTAAKMVERYMKFSQTSNNLLSAALENLKTRHRSTTNTLNTQIDYLQRCLLNERRNSEKLRLALDELSEDISRETYGRRRETSLRLAFLGREENLAESFRRWYRKANESYQRAAAAEEVQYMLNALKVVIEGSNGLLETLNGQPVFEDVLPGSLARILVAQDLVNTLSRELQVETDKRMRLERQLAHTQDAPLPLPVRAPSDALTVNSSIQSSSLPSTPRADGNGYYDTDIKTSDSQAPLVATVESLRESRSPTASMVSLVSQHPYLKDVAAPVPTTLTDENSDSHISLLDTAHLLEPNEVLSEASLSKESDLFLSGPPETEPENSSNSSRESSALDELAQVKTRYDDLQRAFRSCHLALKGLDTFLTSAPQSYTINLIRIAVERLNDFNEDARVELEIRAADEERTIKGFEALLQVRGAIGTVKATSDIEHDIRAFVDGTDKSVARAIQQFSRKLDDVTHDIASIKSYVHQLSAQDHPSSPTRKSSAWTSIAAGIVGSPPRPVSPAPTFGSVITSPRLRHSPSLTQTRTSLSDDVQDTLSTLNLRIPPPPSSSQTHLSPERPRTVSMMNMLGFGSRTNILSSPSATPSSTRKVSLAYSFALDDDKDQGDDIRNDVE